MPKSHEATGNFIFLSHTLTRLMFESFKQARMVIVCKYIFREELVLLLEKSVSLGWLGKEVHKITYKIVSELIEFSSEVKVTQENCVQRALCALDERILLKKKHKKIFYIKKKFIDSGKIKIIIH